MSKDICDICGNEFVWKKGMAYCSYDCAQKARQKLEQQEEKYQEKIMIETQCPDCGSVGVDIERWCDDDHGLHWETFYKCRKCGRKTKDTQWHVYKKPTVFDRITQSHETMADKLVYQVIGYDSQGLFTSYWKSTITEEEYNTKSEAFDATLVKLKEEEK